MNKEQQELVGDAYKEYRKQMTLSVNNGYDINRDYFKSNENGFTPYTQEEFINKCKTNPEFSTKWGLKIEERELSAKERWDWYRKNGGPSGEQKLVALMVYEDEEDNSHIHSWLKTWAPNVPTKLITITYNDKTIESYEI